MALRVQKRSGKIEEYNPNKIQRAMLMAFNATSAPGKIPNISPLVHRVMMEIDGADWPDKTVAAEKIQDLTEHAIMDAGFHETAKAYIIYRHERSLARAKRRRPDKWALPNYIHQAKYARHRSEWERREVYSETVDRLEAMHLDKYPQFAEQIKDAVGFVRRKEILPSMRSMQFGGKAVLEDHARSYNCSYTLVDRTRVFQEIFYLLLCGCGVGYSVQWQHVEKLPPVKQINVGRVRHYTVEDTIKGWADAAGELIKAFFQTGVWVEFNYSRIRPEGTPLKTSGGLAPGHVPLRKALELCRQILLNAQGRSLRPVEASDIICHLADAVLSGGIRRSSLIGIFSAHDTEMLYAKAKGNFRPAAGTDPGLNAHRQNVNISAALERKGVHRSVFDRIIRVAQENFGDPGFIFLEDLNHGTNPCGEIGLNPTIWLPCDDPKHEVLDGECPTCFGSGEVLRTGFAFCNLTTINMATVVSVEDFVDRAWAAAVIGTVQASYTEFPYLGEVTEAIARREALLGVSMTGIQDCRRISLNPVALQAAAHAVVETNKEWAQLLGINQAARTTCVKPEGTASLELGVVGSGMHPHWARRYFRRVTANPNEVLALEFQRINPHMVEVKPNGQLSLIFPIEVPEGSRVVKEADAIEFVKEVETVYRHWVVPGTARPDSSPGLTHNVSCTVTLRDGDLKRVCDYVWATRESFAALAFVPDTIDIKFPFAPNQEVKTPEDEAKWERLVANYRPVDWTKFREQVDGTSLKENMACTADGCAVQ